MNRVRPGTTEAVRWGVYRKAQYEDREQNTVEGGEIVVGIRGVHH